MTWLDVNHQAFGGHLAANDNALRPPRRRPRFLLGGVVSFLLGVVVAVAVTTHHVCEHSPARPDRGAHAQLAELIPTPASPGRALVSLAPAVSLNDLGLESPR